jgi:sulfite reductase (ferredoxin)
VGFLFLRAARMRPLWDQTMTEVKENKAQRAERLKRAKNAWEHFDEIREFARRGWDSIPPEWFSTYFRPWGLYTQGDGRGVLGGSGGEGKVAPFFMVRLRIPNGLLTSHQVRAVAGISEQYGNGVADITVRQNFQLHWIALESLPEVLEKIRAIGLTTTGACGDVTRNITGCPLAGVHAHELADISELVAAVDKEVGAGSEFYNLPRKYKISITACPDWCSYPEINDIGLTAVRASSGQVGFSVRVGGGLSTHPHLAVKLNAFVLPEQVIPVVRGITEIFRDSDVLRQSREKARLKFLFLEHGWNAESFLAALEKRLGYSLPPAEREELPSHVFRDHVGVIPQKQPGLFTVGASVLRGRITPAQLHTVADLAERYGDGHVRNTAMQNLLLVNIPDAHVGAVVSELNGAGLPVQSSAFQRGTVACTGSEFCKLALTETKSFARWLTEELEERFPNFQDDLRLHITGCPNSCGQHWIADIGIEGKKIKSDGKMIDAYYFCVGGSVGQIGAIARPVGYRCAAGEVPNAITRLLTAFRTDRQTGEPLQHFLARTSTADLRAILAGEAAAVVAERDVPAGAVPHSVEDR